MYQVEGEVKLGNFQTTTNEMNVTWEEAPVKLSCPCCQPRCPVCGRPLNGQWSYPYYPWITYC